MSKDKQPKTSLVIINYEGEKFLLNLLKSLKKLKYPNYETIIVDNASKDKSIELIEKYSPEIKIVKNKINRGYSGGCNDGILACSPDSEYIALLNHDIVIHPDWLKTSVEVMNSDERIALVGITLVNPKDNTIQMLGHLATNKNLAKFRRLGAHSNLKDFENRSVIDIDFSNGLVRKSVLKKTGLYDEKYFIMYDEVDFCRRIKEAGYRIVVSPKAKIWHLESESLKKNQRI